MIAELAVRATTTVRALLENRADSAISLRERLARGTFWTVVSTVGSQGLAFGGSILVARILGKEAFGELNMVRTTILVFAVFAGSGLGVLATRHVAETRLRDPERAGRLAGMFLEIALVAGIVVTVICFCTAPASAAGMRADQLSTAIRVGALVPLANSIAGVQLGVVSGLESFGVLAGLTVLDGVLTVVFVVSGAVFAGVPGAMGGTAVAAMVGIVAKQFVMVRQCSSAGIVVRYAHHASLTPELWRSALPGILLGIGFWPFDWLSRLIISRQPHGFEELGAFAAVSSLAQFVLFLPRQLVGPSVPILANLLSRDDTLRFYRVVRYLVLVGTAAALMVALPLSLFSRPLLTLYGASFGSASKALVCMCGANVVWAVSLTLINVFFAAGRIWSLALQHAVLGAAAVTVAVIMRDRGAFGLASANCVAWIAMLLLQAFMVRRVISRKASIQCVELA